MATAIGKAFLEIVGDWTGVSKEAGEQSKSIGGSFGDTFKKLAIGASDVFAAIKVREFANDALAAGRDLSASISRTNVIFGESAGVITQWASTTAGAIGLSQAAAYSMANELGLRLVNALGVSRDRAAEMSTEMLGLAADVAAFNRVPIDEVLNAMERGLLGNTRGLKNLGIAIDDTSSTESIYAGLLQQTNLQRGYAEKSSDSLAGAERRTEAQLSDLTATIGKEMIPAQTAWATFQANKLVPALTGVVGGIMANDVAGKAFVGTLVTFKTGGDIAMGALSGIGAVAGPLTHVIQVGGQLGPVFGAMKTGLVSATTATWSFTASLLANPVVLITVGIIALVAALVVLYLKFEPFRELLNSVGGAIKDFALGAVDAFRWGINWIKDNWQLLAAALLVIVMGPFGLVLFAIVKWRDEIVGFFKDLPGRIKGVFGDAGTWLLDAGRAVIQGLIDGVTSKFGAIGDVMGSVASKVKGFLPFSPAREGPFSGSGWSDIYRSGRALADQFTSGIDAGTVDLFGGARGAGDGAPRGAGGGLNVTVHAQTNADPIDISREVAWVVRNNA